MFEMLFQYYIVDQDIKIKNEKLIHSKSLSINWKI